MHEARRNGRGTDLGIAGVRPLVTQIVGDGAAGTGALSGVFVRAIAS